MQAPNNRRAAYTAPNRVTGGHRSGHATDPAPVTLTLGEPVLARYALLAKALHAGADHAASAGDACPPLAVDPRSRRPDWYDVARTLREGATQALVPPPAADAALALARAAVDATLREHGDGLYTDAARADLVDRIARAAIAGAEAAAHPCPDPAAHEPACRWGNHDSDGDCDGTMRRLVVDAGAGSEVIDVCTAHGDQAIKRPGYRYESAPSGGREGK